MSPDFVNSLVAILAIVVSGGLLGILAVRGPTTRNPPDKVDTRPADDALQESLKH